MRKGKSLIGVKVISEIDGADLGHVRDLVFDHDANQVLALLMSEKDLFGLIDAQIIPWVSIAHIGPDAITVVSSNSRIKAGDEPRVRGIMNRNTALSGTRVYTTDGKDLGTLADTYINEQTGHIDGYEISGGFVSDTMTGKRFLPSDHELTMGKDVALVEPIAAQMLEDQKTDQPGGLTAVAHTATEKVGGVYDTAKEKVGGAYAGIAEASVEKQKEFVVGKTASRDVSLPSGDATSGQDMGRESSVPGAPALDLTPSGEVVEGGFLVKQGEVITAAHADQAVAKGVLGQLVASAAGGLASGTFAAGSEQAGNVGANMQERAEQAAIGKTAAREVTAADGSTLVAEGQIVTQGILDHARIYGKEKEVVAVAGIGAASQAAQSAGQTVGDTASNLWEAAKNKVSELTQVAHEKKAEHDQSSEQNKINYAVGRPTTRVILDPSDNVILNTGDIITHAAINQSREAGVLDVLLSSVHDAMPDITPEMMRVESKGEAALEGQQQPSGGPIAATVMPNAPSQDTPAQGSTS